MHADEDLHHEVVPIARRDAETPERGRDVRRIGVEDRSKGGLVADRTGRFHRVHAFTRVSWGAEAGSID